MRAVALSDKSAQEKIAKHFVPLKLAIQPRSPEFPLDWQALAGWRFAYKLGKGEGFTGCTIVSPDLEIEYASTGSAMVWEMFDSIAYDAQKFNAMLDRGDQRAAIERAIFANKKLNAWEKQRQLASVRVEFKEAMSKEGRFQLPPKGFTIEDAMDLFRLSGDLPPKEEK
jgi:hypothetical protein